MAWTNLSYAFGSTLTSAKMTQLFNNFSAIANGQSGAPKIQTAAFNRWPFTAADINAGAIDGDRLNTATGSTSGTVSSLGINWITLVAGPVFYPNLRYVAGSAGGRLALGPGTVGAGSVDNPTIGIHEIDGIFAGSYQLSYRRMIP